jgi:hypothetical protein
LDLEFKKPTSSFSGYHYRSIRGHGCSQSAYCKTQSYCSGCGGATSAKEEVSMPKATEDNLAGRHSRNHSTSSHFDLHCLRDLVVIGEFIQVEIFNFKFRKTPNLDSSRIQKRTINTIWVGLK